MVKTDAELIQRVVAGDFEAFGQLVSRYQGLVFGVAFGVLRNAEDARDVAQSVFIRAFMKIGQVQDAARLGSWLRQIAVNECRAFLAKNRDWAPLEDSLGSIDPVRPSDDRLLVNLALKAIDEPSRLTVALYYLHAYSLKEIGSFLDEPVTTIKSRLRNARAKLRREMEGALERTLNEQSLPNDFADKVQLMLKAVSEGDQATVKTLLEEDRRLLAAEETPGKHSPLHIAAASGNSALTELLLKYGADPNFLDESDTASPLHYAAERGWLDCVKLLVEAGADVNWNKDYHERGPLGWAVVFGTVQHEIAEYLISHGAKLDIFSATALGREEDVRRIVAENPATLQARMCESERFQSPIQFATSCKQFQIGHLLVELGCKVRLAEAAALGMMDAVRDKLRDSAPQEARDVAVKSAVVAGQIEAVRLLLENGANPNAAPEGTSLIFDAMASVNREMAELLLASGADLEFRDPVWNGTALGWEVFFGRPEGVRLALDLGAKPDPHLLDLAKSGEKGELRRYSSGTPTGYRAVFELLSR